MQQKSRISSFICWPIYYLNSKLILQRPCTYRPVPLVKTRLKQHFERPVTVTGKRKGGSRSSFLPPPGLGSAAGRVSGRAGSLLTLWCQRGHPAQGLDTAEVAGKVLAAGWDWPQPQRPWQRYPEMTFSCWAANQGKKSMSPQKLVIALPLVSSIS